jgi:hypothetical protein
LSSICSDSLMIGGEVSAGAASSLVPMRDCSGVGGGTARRQPDHAAAPMAASMHADEQASQAGIQRLLAIKDLPRDGAERLRGNMCASSDGKSAARCSSDGLEGLVPSAGSAHCSALAPFWPRPSAECGRCSCERWAKDPRVLLVLLAASATPSCCCCCCWASLAAASGRVVSPSCCTPAC